MRRIFRSCIAFPGGFRFILLLLLLSLHFFFFFFVYCVLRTFSTVRKCRSSTKATGRLSSSRMDLSLVLSTRIFQFSRTLAIVLHSLRSTTLYDRRHGTDRPSRTSHPSRSQNLISPASISGDVRCPECIRRRRHEQRYL
ncbi:hypothetical protein P170DRAFT_177099 [Aspergillus steynii IBT 23096]|uniref:Uncharacterized protein n=1 Tax=Aspergillus steynii IBT 23096 TaxID=1392250 RepID=A0A2I2G8H6_9EURO|nr:uncharacterized protein P170DRAFT_177099 [Aspergillus steynii IBT 23096]PLB49175.1 hypothetical protein P170DRAFT_177099 [Aspergillus steynii IBT 23096]